MDPRGFCYVIMLPNILLQAAVKDITLTLPDFDTNFEGAMLLL